ncbi:zinc finger protein 271-like isoform X2 [Bicyclus anynana]|uniref:Zinc finger protein 271-like isoform X2 n=1 Tax=Bicyclus anynana TaxID=110368 RepID=A0ABM3M440_BICAN|nr:zinc finger protein 271-like isoform X2 [Bicyclus anynana]
MRCCVPFCENTFDNMSTSERTGITFHGLPSEGNLRTAWLRALSTQDHHLPDPAVVCSQHFLDDDFYTTESCVRQIHSNAVPSIVQMCMICLDSDSKLSLMSKHKLEEAYEQLTGLSLCRRGNLKQTLCVMCAQRLINFSRFRDLSLRAHSLLTDSVEQRASNTIQHKELMNCTSAHLKCNLTQTTLGANHCDLYIDHTDGEESVVGDVATVVVKNENSSDSMSSADNLELAQEDDNHIDNSNNECASDDEYSDMSIELESRLLDEAISQALRRKADHVAATQSSIKSESDIFQCEFCFEDFVQELAYKEHKSKHLQSAASGAARAAVSRSCDSLVLQDKSVYNDTACAASQVCEPRAAVSCSCDSLVLQNKTGSLRLNDDPPPSADCAQALVAPLSARLAANNDNKVQATEEAGAIQKSEQILETNIDELDKRSSQSGTKPYTDINRFTNCVVQLYDIFKKPKQAVLDEKPRVRIHTAAKPYSCQILNYKCAPTSRKLKHKMTHRGEKPFSCEICNYKCARKWVLLQHIKTHTGEKAFSCEICKYKCARKSYLLQHIKTHTGEKPYSCDICNYKFAQQNNLLQHIKTHTGEKPFFCDICNYKCARKWVLLQHIKTHTGEKAFSCEICNYKCARNSQLLQHMTNHTGEKPFFCEICNYKCAQKSHLLRHIKTHTGEKPFFCEICNYKCAQKSHLLRHIKTHTGEKPFSCEICNYKCARKSHLLRHIKTHTGEKPFSCEICNYKCVQKSHLLRHIKTHTGEKPFSCEICNYKCVQKNHLSQHIKTHTGEKPFSCEKCNFKCARKSHLLRHIKTHTGEKPFSCEICNYKCEQKSHLSQHIKTHTGEKPFSCEKCNFKFARKSEFLLHIGTHDNNCKK